MRRFLHTCARTAPMLALVPVMDRSSDSTALHRPMPMPSAPQPSSESVLATLMSSIFGSTSHSEASFEEEDEFSHDSAPARSSDEPPLEEFDDVEHAKSFNINDVNGVNIMLMTTLTGVMERERASAGVQIMIDKGYHTMYIYSDDRNPSVSAVFQPGPEGHILRLAGAHRVADGTTVELEGQFNPSTVYGLKAGIKHRGSDYVSSASLKSGQQGNSAEFAYYQRVHPRVNAGGSLGADLTALTPYPKIGALTSSVYGSYQQDKNTWLFRYNGANSSAALHLYREADKNVELGCYYKLNAETLETTAGVACKLGLGKEAGPGMPSSVLTVNASNDQKVAVSWSTTSFSSFSSTQLLTILSAALDHRNQEHSIGAQFQFHY